jgi:hypothetical protein
VVLSQQQPWKQLHRVLPVSPIVAITVNFLGPSEWAEWTGGVLPRKFAHQYVADRTGVYMCDDVPLQKAKSTSPKHLMRFGKCSSPPWPTPCLLGPIPGRTRLITNKVRPAPPALSAIHSMFRPSER